MSLPMALVMSLVLSGPCPVLCSIRSLLTRALYDSVSSCPPQLLEKTIRLGAGPELSKEKAEKASRVMDSQMDDEEVEEVTGVFLGSGMGDVFGLEKEEELAAMNAPPPQVEYVVNVVSADVFV